ncbi:hypothetical protein ACP70R_026902 [Stipagrostis hirtigluma subsp. patula]
MNTGTAAVHRSKSFEPREADFSSTAFTRTASARQLEELARKNQQQVFDLVNGE